MPNRLDEISRVIGNIEAEVRNLSASIADVRRSAAEQHCEDRERLESISKCVEKIEEDIKPALEDGYDDGADRCELRRARWKIAGAFALGTNIITTRSGGLFYCSPAVLNWVVSLFR